MPDICIYAIVGARVISEMRYIYIYIYTYIYIYIHIMVGRDRRRRARPAAVASTLPGDVRQSCA